MRVSLVCFVFLFLTSAALAQDSNFPQGPQYLMNFGEARFARSIATPTLTIPGPVLGVGANNATGDLAAGADDTTARRQAPTPPDLFSIFYGLAKPGSGEIQMSGNAPDAPASLAGDGVGQIVTAASLRERGYGLTLAQAAAQGKAHAGHAGHVYTNADLERLRSGS